MKGKTKQSKFEINITLCTKNNDKQNSHWAVVELLSSDEKKNCCSVVGLGDFSCIVVRGNKTVNGWSDDASSNDRSRWSWFLCDDFFFECFVADGTISPDGITDERLKFAGKSKNDDDDDDVVEAGDIGVNVNDDDEHVEFVGLGHILGEFGGGNKSVSCWIGLKCVLSFPFVVDEEEGIEERMWRDCWVVSKFVLDSIKPGDGDSLENVDWNFVELFESTYGELVGPNNDSLSLPIRLFLLFSPDVESSPSIKKK
jgi:hypothetical protein